MQEVTLQQCWRLGAKIHQGGFGEIHEAESLDGTAVIMKMVPLLVQRLIHSPSRLRVTA